MRFIRLIFVAALALVLVAVALANREAVVLSAFPANFGQYLGGTWSVTLPLFLVIFVAFALGMLAGLIWEWLREGHIRREARRHSAEVARLEGEVGQLRQRHAAPRDEVLAILDEPSAAPATTLPAVR
ncbi:MAG: LapA family protein [Paracoccus sp.]|uniref:LapA family protein n=1 Tax=Paracoccus hibiscisoli TaxID=2023261 RepID=A0A4U0QV06_9RHOB|nr:LapA family protein [Paracoccus hibiscisoli]MCG6110861.1 LapA family protein [Paracoccus sp. (in: a-proteobacteria)]TJZ85947.1 LapA family protein [Paracoccus hibiscisoli]